MHRLSCRLLSFAAFNSSEEFLENSMELHFAIIPTRGYAFCVDSMEFYRSVISIRPLNCTMSLDYTLYAFALRELLECYLRSVM
jgi:hypothetical protein